MDILIQIIGYSFIPLAGLLVFSGFQDILSGLKDHFESHPLKINVPARITEQPFLMEPQIRLQIPAA